ncbi:hypothetical protein BpHYR1_002298 [Brachionus plicatilis]|uniref:Uncharacterized protein n=1 Tax=Brachionus plicatilis TaxID=10195 RepID=A0A3M7REA5_BRAPC|nr:hypothetical protein BpHYR1_002298 [Brachionus plicatilis]
MVTKLNITNFIILNDRFDLVMRLSYKKNVNVKYSGVPDLLYCFNSIVHMININQQGMNWKTDHTLKPLSQFTDGLKCGC